MPRQRELPASSITLTDVSPRPDSRHRHPSIETPIRVLLVAERENDHLAAKALLAASPTPIALDWVGDSAAAVVLMSENRHQVYLIDYHLAPTHGLDVWHEAVDRGCLGGVIFIAAVEDRDIDLRAMESGAYDYIPKRNATTERLERAIRYAARLSRQAARLQHLAHTDALTGQANRRTIGLLLGHAIERAKRVGTPLALLFVDLDRFKPVNDHHGHRAGDKVLREVARRLREAVRRADVVGRLGGAEFAVLLEAIESEAAAERVARKIVDAIDREIALGGPDGPTVRVGASIGIAFCRCPRSSQAEPDDCVTGSDGASIKGETSSRGGTAELARRLMNVADRAMYRCKAAGGRGVQTCSLEANGSETDPSQTQA
jgi:diguanylate cyclase (GGDEF)-like protein